MARLSAVIGTSTALTGLSPFTNYSIMVLAYTSAGDGDYSKGISCATETEGVNNFILFRFKISCSCLYINFFEIMKLSNAQD